MAFVIVALMLGVILAIVAAIAIWLALGNRTLMWRAILAIVGVSGAALVLCASSGEFEAEWLGLVWVVVVATTALFVFLRWLGYRLANTRTGERIRSDEMQFSLTQLMALTAVVAAVAAVARMLAPLVATMNALIFGIAVASCVGALALVAVWATLRSDLTRVRLVILALVAMAVAGVVYYGVETTNADPGLVWGSVVIIYTITLAGLLLLARSYGVRLLRNSDLTWATARDAAEPADATKSPGERS
jgi:hypothetical protein